MGESVKVTIIQEDEFSYINPSRFTVVIKMTPEFMHEPAHIISDEEKAEYISQMVANEFYKELTKHLNGQDNGL